MAFNQSSVGATYVPVNGVQPNIVYGVVALSSGTITVTMPGNREVITAMAHSQTSNAARVSATSGATITITGTGSDIATWFAIVK